MAKADRSAFKAGLFIVVSLVLIGFIVVGIKGFGSVLTPMEVRHVRFSLIDDVGGLRLGDDVRLGGYKVGTIHSITVQNLAEGQKPDILITFTVPASYPLREDTHMTVQGTLTGSSWLNIDNLGTGAVLAEDGELQGHPSSTSTLLATLEGAAPELEGILHDVHGTTVPKLNTAMAKAADLLDSAHTLATDLSNVVGDKNSDLRVTLANLRAVSGQFQTKAPGLLDHVDAAVLKLSNTIDDAQDTLKDIKVVASNLRDVSDSAKGIIVGNRGKFDGIIAGLETTSENLKGASAEIRRAPWRLLYKPAPGELDNLTLFDAARDFAEGAQSVDDAAKSLRDAINDPQIDRATLQKLTDQLSNTFANFNEVERKLWDAVKQ